MIGAVWFLHGGRWHALVDGETTEAECGLRLLAPPKHPVVATADSPVPPAPCRTCFVEVGMREVVDESIESALGRGYELYVPGDDD